MFNRRPRQCGACKARLREQDFGQCGVCGVCNPVFHSLTVREDRRDERKSLSQTHTCLRGLEQQRVQQEYRHRQEEDETVRRERCWTQIMQMARQKYHTALPERETQARAIFVAWWSQYIHGTGKSKTVRVDALARLWIIPLHVVLLVDFPLPVHLAEVEQGHQRAWLERLGLRLPHWKAFFRRCMVLALTHCPRDFEEQPRYQAWLNGPINNHVRLLLWGGEPYRELNEGRWRGGKRTIPMAIRAYNAIWRSLPSLTDLPPLDKGRSKASAPAPPAPPPRPAGTSHAKASSTRAPAVAAAPAPYGYVQVTASNLAALVTGEMPLALPAPPEPPPSMPRSRRLDPRLQKARLRRRRQCRAE